jgi:hypothetical protein
MTHELAVKILRIPPLLAIVLAFGNSVFAGDREFFHEQVLPLLKRQCYACHSHASGVMEGNLALDWRSGWETGGDRGPAIVPGSPETSILILAVSHRDQALRMPEQRLPDEDIDLLVRWVATGAFDDRARSPEATAADTNWWSLKPLVQPAIPFSDGANPIDAFVRQRLQEAGLSASARADRKTLIRRVTYDLTGLPPAYAEVEAFLADPRSDAYELLVDRLLASPRYGERWARHWLDTVHFADSHGYEHDIGRDHAWRYRDYVIDALNQDVSWDRFIREQLAVDYFFPDRSDLIPALGFLGAGTFDLSTYSTATATFDYLARDDLVAQTMSAFASTTASCARCHTHKFDPITQEDYYSLQAVFAGILKGDLAFDDDRRVARARAKWHALLEACKQKDASVLFSAPWVEAVESWARKQAEMATWHPLTLHTFTSSDGATLIRMPSGIVLASGISPDKDTTTITATTQLTSATALRLDLFPHESLPMNGPGRCQNGNLHLSEISVHMFAPGSDRGELIQLRRASADFNQAGWGIERAIDGDAATAWGIHPAVGVAHHAVFEFGEPISLAPGTRFSVTLRQLHGGSHLIGAFNMSLTADNPEQAVVLPEEIRRILQRSPAERDTESKLELAAHALGILASQQIESLPPQVFVYAAAPAVNVPEGEGKVQPKSIPIPKVVHVLHRGDFDKPRTEVQPGALSALHHAEGRFRLLNPEREAQRRAALADWLAHSDNPLTWRSVVNRVWQFHFGRGICDTPSDFGRMGGQPSHPELLDWLAIWFRDEAHGSLKQLHRMILTSETYQQSSQHRSDGAAIDESNLWLWRQNRQRMDADSVRDGVLEVSGAMDLKMAGPGVQHFSQSKGPQATPALDYVSYDWDNPGASRRSIYRYVWRGIADPFMESLDFPDLGLLSPTRGLSVSALQALTLFNNDFILHFSQAMAERALGGVDSDATTWDQNIGSGEVPKSDLAIVRCVHWAWLRDPTESEFVSFREYVEQYGLAAFCRLLLNSNEFLFID